MLNINPSIKVYLKTGVTDMRKGINGLCILAQTIVTDKKLDNAIFAFRGRRSDRVKLIWYDGQGFCLYYKCLDKGKFPWPKDDKEQKLSITQGQLSMLLEAIDWRNPTWSAAPVYTA